MSELKLPEIKRKSLDINLSPLVDVVFLLLIFFMVTTVFPDKSGIIIEKPDSENAASMGDENIIVKIDAKDNFYIQDKPLNLNDLRRVLKSKLDIRQNSPVIIHADKNAKTEILVKVIDAAKSSGAKQIGLATNDKIK